MVQAMPRHAIVKYLVSVVLFLETKGLVNVPDVNAVIKTLDEMSDFQGMSELITEFLDR